MAKLSKAGGFPTTPPLHVVLASPEIVPFAKTGGLGDVLGYLPLALEKLGLRVSLIMPAYQSVLGDDFPIEDTGISFDVPVSHRVEEGRLLKTMAGDNISVYFIRADRYFNRECLYGTSDGDYPDNAERYAFFSRAILEVLKLDPPQIFHANDWQTALSIAFLKAQPHLYPELAAMKTVFTIHNLGYQGIFPQKDWHLLNLDAGFFTPHYLEFYGDINFMKGGLVFADAITTVSPTYAEEIKTPELGSRLEGVLQERAASLFGILNGVDYNIWNPENDPFIAEKFSPKDSSGKKACKTDIQQYFHLPENPDVPLIGMVSRLSVQKGFELVEKSLDELFSRDIQFVLLGTGDSCTEDFFHEVHTQYPEKAGVEIGFDESIAHKIIAGSDMFLMPSCYEPCGLGQLYSLKYGTIPIVRATGGLKDTVRQFNVRTGKGDGFLFSLYSAEELLKTVDKALNLWQQQKDWTILMKNAMAADFSWDSSARLYVQLYQSLVKK